jgi:hypothetical protein
MTKMWSHVILLSCLGLKITAMQSHCFAYSSTPLCFSSSSPVSTTFLQQRPFKICHFRRPCRTHKSQTVTMLFGDLPVASSELQQMLRRDIGRRYTELNALGWLGRAWLLGSNASTVRMFMLELSCICGYTASCGLRIRPFACTCT